MLTSLNKKIFYLVSGIVLSFSLITLLTVWIATTKYAKKDISQEFSVAKKISYNVLYSQEKDLLRSSEVLAADFGFRQAVSIGDTGTLSSVLENHRQRIDANVMLLFSLAGDLLSSSSAVSDANNSTLSKAVQEIALTDHSATSIMFIEDTLYQVVLIPIKTPAPKAIVLTGFEISQAFANDISKISNHEISVTTIVSDRQQLITSTLVDAKAIGANKTDLIETWKQALDKPKNYYSEKILIYRNKDLDVYLHFHKSMNDFMSEFKLLKLEISVITVFLFIISTLLAGIISRKMTTPLSKLAGIADNISNENYDHKITTNTEIEEIASLAQTLNKMQLKIQSREKKIQRHYLYHQRLLETISSIIIGINASDQVAYWNSSAEKILCIDRVDAYNNPILTLGVSWDWKIISREILNTLVEKKQSRRFELPVTLKDGKTLLLLATIAPFLEEGDEERSGYLIIADDITDSKLEDIRQQQAAKLQSIGQLAAGVAHEINTPIQYVGDNIRFLEEAYGDLAGYILAIESFAKGGIASDGAEDPLQQLRADKDIDYLSSEIPTAINQSLEGVERITSIVKAMKDFSHPGSDEKAPADINRAIESTVALAKNVWKYVAELEIQLDQNLKNVPCILDKFNEVILNLVVNAADAIESSAKHKLASDGLIKVMSKHCAEYAEICISDNGDGIPKSIIDQIFDPFFTTKVVGKGTGQGLSICHDIIVDKHNGELFCQTEPGQGTTFIIRLPL